MKISVDIQEILVYYMFIQEILELRGVKCLSIPYAVKALLVEHGVKQKWIIERMNRLNPSLNMDRSKFSAIVRGGRKMTGDELLIFCKALGESPDSFYKIATDSDTSETA